MLRLDGECFGIDRTFRGCRLRHCSEHYIVEPSHRDRFWNHGNPSMPGEAFVIVVFAMCLGMVLAEFLNQD